MKKKVLIIDNEDQSEEIEQLIRDAGKKGIGLECEQFKVGSTEETGLLTNGKIDLSKVIKAYKERYRGTTFNLVAFDWDLNDDNIDGIELLRCFTHNKIFRNTKKVLYSGLLEIKLSSMLDDFKDNKIKKDFILKRIKTLVNADIIGFVERENYDKFIISALEKMDDSIDFILEDELSKFPDLQFKGAIGHPSFRCKTYSEIIEIITNNDHLRNDLKRELIQHSMAYMTENL